MSDADGAAEMFDAADRARREQLRAGYRDLAQRHRALFDEYLAAGFDDRQALELILAHSELED